MYDTTLGSVDGSYGARAEAETTGEGSSGGASRSSPASTRQSAEECSRDGNPLDETVPDVPRREYLKAVGAAGVAGSLVGPASGAVAAQSDDWEVAADERIQEHRTGRLEVAVIDEDGDPVPDASVEVEQREHDYWFGNVLSAELLVNETEPGHPYREHLQQDCNVVWFGNYHKWRFFEENRETSDRATAWAKDNGLDVRGHTCLWANADAWAVPGDVVDAMGVDHESGQSGADLDPEHVRNRTFDHVREIIEHYADFEYDGEQYGSVIDEWEVTNEVVHEPGLIRAVNGVPADQEASDVDPVTAPVLAEWYRHAREAAPDDVGLATNDYNTMEGSHEYARSGYEDQIEFLAANGHLDYAGIQSHFTDRDTAVTPREALDVLDRYAQHGVRLRVTEFDATGDDWSDEEKGEFFHDYLTAVFSHEATDAFLVAGGGDANHWRDDAPFFYDDWTPKPAYETFDDLVYGEWWTSDGGTTAENGTYPVDAFYGEYDVTVSSDGEQRSVEVSHVDEDGADTRAVVSLPVDGGDGPCEDAGAEPMEVEGQTVCDLDGDGSFRDVTGDGEVDQSDVTAFFEVQHKSAWQQDAFDFSGNGAVNQFDVVELFDYTLTN